ncbi:uncharacterized protein LOC121748574 isoform X2 [Salvia splendens]|uniref:uncharacterized protein LOC121748574 isoform X2 n=1 Tax=Salvia splendens TaxID=180675 RepID=UPI001C26FB02|nr:uncharacterized protein LOC121748574 isoform X2 [Salvia splendens]
MENPNSPIGGTAPESDPDSGVCGKGKRGKIEDTPEIDSGGGEIAKIDSGGDSSMASRSTMFMLESESNIAGLSDINLILPSGEVVGIDSAGREISGIDSGAIGKRKRGETEDIPEIDSGGCEIAEIDSDASGKLEIGGNESAEYESESDEFDSESSEYESESEYEYEEIDQSEEKEKEKKTRKVEKFEDRYGILGPYDKEMVFEKEGFKLDDYIPGHDQPWYDERLLEDIKITPYDHEAVIKYISQVRLSSGFDVDTILPSWLKHEAALYFTPMWLSHATRSDLKYVNKAAKIAIHEINLDMKNKTSFKLVEVTNVVVTWAPFFLLFLTLAVEKVEEEAQAQAQAEAATIRAVVHHPICKPWQLEQWWVVKPDPTDA